VEDGDSTKDIVDKLIQSEEEAIEAYEDLIPDTDLDLRVMLCGFLKDERDHLKALTDARDEMGGSRYDGEDKPKHTIYENRGLTKKVKLYVDWDDDGAGLDPNVEVDVPVEIVDSEDSTALYDYLEEWFDDQEYCVFDWTIVEIEG
jgi:rubrerythrin